MNQAFLRFPRSFVLAVVLVVTCVGSAFPRNNQHTGYSMGLYHSVTRPATPARQTIEGRIVAVRRLSQIVTVQTADGETHDVRVPDTATIMSKDGSHFNIVRSGQHIRLTAIKKPGGELEAHSLAIP